MEKHAKIALLMCVVGSIAVGPQVLRAQTASDEFVKWASSQAVQLHSIEPEGDLKDLLPLKSLIGQPRVVAIGEPNHGTHEPLALRNRLIRFLVEEMGFTAVALETGFTESFALERFVTGGAGDLGSTVQNAMSWGFGNFPENQELIQWIRQYNAATNHNPKIKFYGIDLSGAQDGAFPQARRAVDFAITYLRRRDSVSAERILKNLEPLLKQFSTWNYSSLSSADRERLSSGFEAITAALRQERAALVSISSQQEYDWAIHSVAVARQLKNMFDVSPKSAWTKPGIPPEAWRASAARDSGMAENVRWILQRETPAGRLVVFAHNNHVMNSCVTGGIWSAYQQSPSAMGKFLRPMLGRDLIIIGGASGASPDGKPLKPDSANLDYTLAAIGVSQFVLDLRAAKENGTINAWLSEPRSLHSNIESYVTMVPSETFDFLYFVRELTPTRARKR